MRVVLDGEALPVDAMASPWLLVGGVDPYEVTLELEAGQADRLFEASEPGGSWLEQSDGTASQRFEHLTILGTGPGATPYLRTLVLADMRYTWASGPLIHKRFNVPRKSGGVRRLGSEDDPLAARQLVEDLTYRQWSLKDGLRSWKASEILAYVLDRCALPDVGWVDRDGVLNGGAGELPLIQDLALSLPAGPALATVLAKLGGRANVFVRPSGELVLYDQLNGAERELVGLGRGTRTRGAGVPAKVGGPLWAVQDRRRERPSAVRVFFLPACEIRVDHKENDDGDTVGRDRPPRCHQVGRFPEDVTTSTGDVLVESTWGRVSTYLTFLRGKQLAGLPVLTEARLRKGWLHGLPEAYAQVDGTGVWANRAAFLRTAYRAQYQLPRVWRDNVVAIRPYRVSIEDPESASQGASLVYQDWSEWVTWRGIKSKRASDPPKLHEVVQNRYANPAATAGGQIVGTPIADLTPSPAILSVLDEDLGIFGVSFALDFTGQASQRERSALVKQRIPSHDTRGKNVYLQEGWLSDTHELSTILTVQPAAPNDRRQLYEIKLTVGDVADLLPQAAHNSREAEGPVLDVLVEPSRELARFGWADSRSAEIFRAFDRLSWNDDEGGDVDDNAPNRLQDAYGEPVNAERLKALARSIAASVYTSYEDHVEGGLATGFQPGLEPMGTARAVGYQVARDGAWTSIDLPPTPPKVSDRVFLPAGVQRVVDRFVDP